MNRVLTWLRAQSMQRQVTLVVMIAIVIGCIGFPLSLHRMTLARIREANLDAIRFASVAPEQLRSLPVTGWRDGPKIATPHIQKVGWEQYQMSLPCGEISTIIDIDLRSTLLPLMLGFGGGLRIAGMIVVSGVAAHFLLKYGCGWCSKSMLRREAPKKDVVEEEPSIQGLVERVLPPPGIPFRKCAATGYPPVRRHPFHETPLLFNAIKHIPHPTFYFDTHHQLVHWNDAAQAVLPQMALSSGIHVLDLSAHLPWGNEMIEKMDEVAQQSAVIIHKGDSLCVIPG